MPITYKEKVNYYLQALNEGTIDHMEDPVQYSQQVEEYLKNFPTHENVVFDPKGEEIEVVDLSEEEPLVRDFRYDLPPAAQLREIANIGTMDTNLAAIAAGYNVGAPMFKAVAYRQETEEGASEGLGLTTQIDRYEKAWQGATPLYFKWYKGVRKPDVLTREQFDKEKFYNKLPQEVKDQYRFLVYEE